MMWQRKIKETGDYNKIKLFKYDADYEKFAEKNSKYLKNIKSDKGIVKFGQLVGLKKTFDADVPLKSRKSYMSMMLEHDGNYLPTNVCVDPIFRQPKLGNFADDDSEEEIETARSNRYALEPLAKKVCMNTGSNKDFLKTGRTLINYAEFLLLKDTIGDPDDKLYLIPYSDLTDQQLI